jgi:hypothetical protein
MKSVNGDRPPRDNLVRSVHPGVEMRAAAQVDGMPTLFGHFAVFDRWTHIDSFFEGSFMERLAPGAFKKTMAESGGSIKCLFQHGQDARFGMLPLGPITELREDKTGAYYEVSLLDNSLNRDLLPALEQGLLGASFRFRVIKEEMNQEPDRSDANPDGLPERTIQEVELREFGPVTFPAYSDATAAVRGMTDEFIVDAMLALDAERVGAMVAVDPGRWRAFVQCIHAAGVALPDSRAEEPHSDMGSRRVAPDSGPEGAQGAPAQPPPLAVVRNPSIAVHAINGLPVVRNPNRQRR